MANGPIEKIYEDVQLHIAFSQAASRSNIVTYDSTAQEPENISTAFGKLSKWYEALVPTGGSSGKILAWNSSGTAKWSDPLHPTITKSADTTSTVSPAHGGTFTTVDSVTRDANGHVTKINTKTVTLPSDQNTDTLMTQTNTTTSADYRVLLSGNANDTTETTTGRKSTNLKFNPSSGGLYSFGFLWTDITGQTLDINTLTLSNGTLHSRRFIEKTDGGAANITNIPVTGHPFLLEVDLIRWGSTTDYITRQRFTNAANGTYSYVRYCTNGTWGSWTTRKYTDTDTKVTSSANHYTPATASGQDKTASASGATAAWSIDVVKGVTLNTDGKGHVTGISVTSGKIPANPVPSNNVTGNAAWTAADRILVTNAASGNVIKQSAYTIGATLNSGTTNQLAYYSGANAISATHDGTNTGDSLYFKTGTNAKSSRQIILGIYGQTYGNDAAALISGTAGVFSYGDGGPQIDFNTSVSGSQAGALIFTDHDSAATGASWHFVSNQADWNVTSKRFHARTSISIGTDLPQKSYNLYVNGTSQFNGTTTISTNAFGTQLTVERSGSSNYASLGFKNNLGMLGYIGANATDANLYHIYAGDTSKQYIILDTGNTSVTTSGSGNAITALSFSNGTFTATKGSTFSLSTHTHNYAGSSSAGGAATSANKLNTNAGSDQNPVYFSNGIPVACKQTTNKSWYGVPEVRDDGVMEIGKIIDFHSANTSTADYDLRLQYTGTATGKIVTLPGAAGTVALLTKGSTSYWGMIDGDGGTTGWIRTTSNGLISATGVSLANGGDGSLGTSSWAFKNAYIANINGVAVGSTPKFTDANVTQAVADSSYTNYRPLLIGNSSGTSAGFTPTLTTAGTYATAGIYCKPSSGYVYASDFMTNTYPSGTGSSLSQYGLYLKSYFKCADSSQTVLQYAGYGVRTYSGKITSSDGIAMAVGCGGLTVLGSGESAHNLISLISDDQKISGNTTLNVGGTLNTTFAGNSEVAIVSSDDSIYLITNCQTIANRKPVCLDTNSYFYPGTNKTGSIGTSSYMWNSVYAATIYENGTSLASKYAAIGHAHGLLHSDLTQVASNGTTGGWSVIGIDPAVNGYVLKSIRINETSPNWLSGGYGAGIAFGGYDTKGVISMRWDSPVITFAGGNHKSTITSPKWYFKISGTSGSTYDLANFNAATATTAGKLSNTSAIGSSIQPVYFNANGVPVACTQDANQAHFSTVPFVKNDGVMEVGRYFDMHSTNTGTTDYDVRLDASGVSSFRFTFNTPTSSSIAPSTNNQTSLGTSSLKWSNVYATTFYGALSGNASTATKLETARNIALAEDFAGSADFDGSGNISISGTFYRCSATSNNTANYPWHRIAYRTGVTGNYNDTDAIFMIRAFYNGGPFGIIKVTMRTNGSGANCQVAARWLVRQNIAANDVYIAQWGKTGQSVYADIFLKGTTYNRAYVYQIAGGRLWTLVNSNEASDTTTSDKKTSTEVYASIAAAGTALHNQAYTQTVAGIDEGHVNSANSATYATRADYVNVVAGNEIRFYNDNQLKANNHFWLGYSWAAGSHYTPSGGSDTSSTTAPNITEFVMGNCTAGGLASVHAKTFILGNGSSPMKSSKTTTIATAATTTDRTITLPNASGNVILGTKGSTSFWGLMDGAGSISEWIRATSSGFIPSQGAKFFQTATSSLGTNTWYFKNSYIQYMNANSLILGAAKTADGAAKGQLKFFSGNSSDATGTVTLECIDDVNRTGDYTVKLPTCNGTIPVFEKLFEGASNTVSLSYSDIDEYDVFLITVANSNATSEQVTVTSVWISNVAGVHDMPLIWGGAPTSSGGACNVTSGWIQLSKNSGTTTFIVAHKSNVAQMTSSGWSISSPTYNLYIRKIFGLKTYKRT